MYTILLTIKLIKSVSKYTITKDFYFSFLFII